MRESEMQTGSEQGDSHTGAYCLCLRPMDGGYHVTRSEFWMWGGALTRMNEQRVTRQRLPTREAAREFAGRYAAEHPGCMTGDQAAQRFVPEGSYS